MLPMVFDMFSPDMAAQKRPNMAQRRLRDRLDCFVLRLPFSLSFGTVFGFVLVPFWVPKIDPWERMDVTQKRGVQASAGVVLARFFFCLAA